MGSEKITNKLEDMMGCQLKAAKLASQKEEIELVQLQIRVVMGKLDAASNVTECQKYQHSLDKLQKKMDKLVMSESSSDSNSNLNN